MSVDVAHGHVVLVIPGAGRHMEGVDGQTDGTQAQNWGNMYITSRLALGDNTIRLIIAHFLLWEFSDNQHYWGVH